MSLMSTRLQVCHSFILPHVLVYKPCRACLSQWRFLAPCGLGTHNCCWYVMCTCCGLLADARAPLASGPASEADSDEEKTDTIASFLDKQLEEEFKNEEIASQTKTDLNETLSKEKVRSYLPVVQAVPTSPIICEAVGYTESAVMSTLLMTRLLCHTTLVGSAGISSRAGGQSEPIL